MRRSLLALGVAFATNLSHAGTMTYVDSLVPNALPLEVGMPAYTFMGGDEGKFLYNGKSITAFCIEPWQESSFPSEYTPVILDPASTRYQLANSLFTQFYNNYHTTAVGTAALAAMVWEIWVDGANGDLASGNFFMGPRTDPAVAALAKTMFSATYANSFAPGWTFTQYLSPDSQDLMQGTPNSVPAPAGLALLCAGALAGWLVRRR